MVSVVGMTDEKRPPNTKFCKRLTTNMWQIFARLRQGPSNALKFNEAHIQVQPKLPIQRGSALLYETNKSFNAQLDDKGSQRTANYGVTMLSADSSAATEHAYKKVIYK